MSIAKTLLAAAAAERIAALRAAYLEANAQALQQMRSRLEAPADASPELRAVLAEVRAQVTIKEREGDAYPEISVPTEIIRQAHAAGVMNADVLASDGRIHVGSCYYVYSAGHYPWTAGGLDQYRRYEAWRAWRDAMAAVESSGLS